MKYAHKILTDRQTADSSALLSRSKTKHEIYQGGFPFSNRGDRLFVLKYRNYYGVVDMK